MAAMLEISGVHTFYGHIEALHGIDIDRAARARSSR